jgi:hypothetical protein
MRQLKYIGAFVIISAILGGAVAALAKLNFWIAFAMAAAAIYANGLLAMVEDDMPGGFNNPDGSSTPAYVSRIGLALKVIAGILAIVAIVALGYRFVGGLGSHAG